VRLSELNQPGEQPYSLGTKRFQNLAKPYLIYERIFWQPGETTSSQLVYSAVHKGGVVVSRDKALLVQ